ncbi:MAG: alpha/beta hydrolase [Chloroflexaceae bacterium]|jgi:pimeloyl-ACP methyl ester carboxylesterase|nr:alpha/beta hydrolase [Chloroflexaceae bacterium]
MQTQSLQFDGQTVVYHTSGSGPAVLLIHGNSGSGLSFQRQLDAPALQHCHLVAIDLPGFGASQPVANPERVMGLQGWAATVRAVVEALKLDPVVLVGWSLGGHIALEVVDDLPQARGVLIFGTPPIAFPPDLEQAFLPNPALASAFKPDLSEEETHAFVSSFFLPGTAELPAAFLDDIRRSDGQARAAVAGSIRPDGYKDEVALVANLKVPLAVLHGEGEQLANGDYIAGLSMPTLWRNHVQIISGAGHAPQWEQPAHFNELLAAFVADCVG